MNLKRTMQKDIREKEVNTRENVIKSKANNLSGLELPPNPTVEDVQQLARRLMLQQINFTHTDRKGKDLMTDETKMQLKAIWEQLEQSGMLDMDSLMSELGSVTRAAAESGI